MVQFNRKQDGAGCGFRCGLDLSKDIYDYRRVREKNIYQILQMTINYSPTFIQCINNKVFKTRLLVYVL